MFYFGKKTASDLFKIFDQDTNLKVGKKELADLDSEKVALTAKEQAKNLCKNAGLISAGLLSAAAGILALSKNKNFYNLFALNYFYHKEKKVN